MGKANPEIEPSEFPRPCKNCGQMVDRWQNGELKHRQNRSESCPGYMDWTFDRDRKGLPTAMHCRGFVVIPDPPTPEQVDQKKLAEWEQIYKVEHGEG